MALSYSITFKVSINPVGSPRLTYRPAKKEVFVFDRKLGLCKTNIEFESEIEIETLVRKIGRFVGKEVG